MNFQKSIISAAAKLAEEVEADAVLVLTESGEAYRMLLDKATDQKVIALTPNEETYDKLSRDPDANIIDFTVQDPTRTSQMRHAVWRGLYNDLLNPGDVVVCLIGEVGLSQGIDTISAYLVSEAEPALASVIEMDPVMSAVVEISSELGWKGREGEPMGAAFIVGDSEKVMNQSHQLGLNPFRGYDDINVKDSENWELIKRYAFLDGAFIIDSNGNLVAAGRYLDADVDVEIPTGLGTRHMAAAAISAATHTKAVTVSGTDGVIRIFVNGEVVGEIDPRSKLLKER